MSVIEVARQDVAVVTVVLLSRVTVVLHHSGKQVVSWGISWFSYIG